jgi:hypothetical protein
MHSSRTLDNRTNNVGILADRADVYITVSIHLQVVQSAESVSFHLCRYLLLRDMPHIHAEGPDFAFIQRLAE